MNRVLIPNDDQTLLDIALMMSGTIESVFDFGIDITSDLPSEIVINPELIKIQNERVLLQFKKELIKPSTKQNQINNPTSVSYSRKYYYLEQRRDLVQENQTLLDFSLMMTGTVEGVFEIAFKNGLNVTSNLEVGAKILSPEKPIDKENYDYYIKHKLKSATGTTTDQNSTGGINYWGIEIDFIVQ